MLYANHAHITKKNLLNTHELYFFCTPFCTYALLNFFCCFAPFSHFVGVGTIMKSKNKKKLNNYNVYAMFRVFAIVSYCEPKRNFLKGENLCMHGLFGLVKLKH